MEKPYYIISIQNQNNYKISNPMRKYITADNVYF